MPCCGGSCTVTEASQERTQSFFPHPLALGADLLIMILWGMTARNCKKKICTIEPGEKKIVRRKVIKTQYIEKEKKMSLQKIG